jgi:hypothetical protein
MGLKKFEISICDARNLAIWIDLEEFRFLVHALSNPNLLDRVRYLIEEAKGQDSATRLRRVVNVEC